MSLPNRQWMKKGDLKGVHLLRLRRLARPTLDTHRDS